MKNFIKSISFAKKIFYLKDLPLKNKTVLVRVDYNVPLKSGKVIDNSKIKLSLPTINYLLQKKCKIVLATHLGRPEGKIVSKLRVNPLAKELKKLLPHEKITKLNDCLGSEIKKKIEKGKPGEIFLLENLRFYLEEKENDFSFAHSLANLAEIYINNAFGVSHRKHASLDAITKFIPSGAGFLMQKEINQLSKTLKPKKPLTWIIGGVKLDKINLIENALKKADYILIGGALAFSFLKAQGFHVGMSKTDATSIKLAKKILEKKTASKIVLPVDIVIAPHSYSKSKTIASNMIPTNKIGFDIGPKTVQLFKDHLKKSKTILWNGPLGYFEVKPYDKSTRSIADFISKLPAVKVIGGGETSEMIRSFKLDKKMTHVSTGGGASLEFLSGEKLAGIRALEKNYEFFKKKLK